MNILKFVNTALKLSLGIVLELESSNWAPFIWNSWENHQYKSLHFKRFFKIENLLNRNIGQGNKNKRWRTRKQLKAAEITKSTFDRLKILNLKRFCCIHLHTIFLIHRESQIVFYKIVCYNRIFLGRLFCIQARESNWGNFE